MAFLNPLLLLGLLGVAAPIIIHLINQRKIQRVVWAATRFLREVVEKNQRKMNLEDLILLILRCLVLIFLALALARPSFRQGGPGGFGGSDEVAIIALDNSGSMAQTDGASSKFARAQQAAEQVLDGLPSGSMVGVWLVSDVVKGVIAEPTRDFGLARKVIRDARRSDRSTEMQPALHHALEVIQRHPAASKQIFLITDGQASGWKQLAETRAMLAAAAGKVQTRLLLIGDSEQHNLAVTGLRQSSALAPVNEPVRFEVEITNAGVEEARQIQVSLSVDAEPPGDEAGLDSIPAGESKKVSLFGRFREPGFHTVTARLTEDRCPSDDVRTIAVRATGEIHVLLVDGDPGIEPRESEVFFLRNALTPVPPEQRDKYFIKTQTVNRQEFETIKLAEYEAVVLANVVDVSEAALTSLERYLRAGGGLIVFPGGKINPTFYNDRLLKERGMLPAAFGAPHGNAEQQETSFHLQSKGYDHPIVSLWKDAAAGNLATANYFRAFTLQPDRADVPRPESGPPALVLSYGDAQPAVMERTWGFGRVVQFSSTVDAAWNDLCIRPVFVPVMHRVLGALLAREGEQLNGRVGSKFEAVVGAEWVGKDLVISAPGSGKDLPILRRVALTRGLPLVSLDETDTAGAYDVRTGEDATPLLRFAAQSDPGESKLEELSPAELSSFDGVAQVLRWTPELKLRGLLQRERTGAEFWVAFAVLALCTAVAETVLGNRFSQSK